MIILRSILNAKDLIVIPIRISFEFHQTFAICRFNILLLFPIIWKANDFQFIRFEVALQENARKQFI